jgi:biotin carboxyl carrier protein
VKRAFRTGQRTVEVEVRPAADGAHEAVVDGRTFSLRAVPLGDGWLRFESPEGPFTACVTRAGRQRFLTLAGRDYVLETAAAASRRAGAHAHAGGQIAMPMPGLVVRVHVHEGERVARGQVLLVVEAMKMEHTLRAPKDGVVRRLAAEAGKLLEGGAALLEVEE